MVAQTLRQCFSESQFPYKELGNFILMEKRTPYYVRLNGVLGTLNVRLFSRKTKREGTILLRDVGRLSRRPSSC